MSDSGKRKRATCTIEILACKLCGATAVSINDLRVTGHKCAGAWKVIRRETVEVAVLHRAIGQKLAEASRSSSKGASE